MLSFEHAPIHKSTARSVFTVLDSTRVWSEEREGAIEGRVDGILTLEVALFLQGCWDRARARQKGLLVTFLDWSKVSSYTTDARVAWGRFVMERGRDLGTVHFYTKDRLLRMSISVVKMAFPSASFVVHAAQVTYLQQKEQFFPIVT